MGSRKLGGVVVKVDASLKRLYAEALDQFEHASAEGAKSWDRRYEAVAEIIEHSPPLYLAGGFASEGDFFAQVLRENRQSVYRHMRVAKYATPDDIERYTSSRIDAAITFVETKNGGPLKGRNPIDFAKLRFAFKREGKIVNKALADITMLELRDALALLKGREASSKKASPLARALNDVLKRSKVKGASVSVSASQVILRLPIAGVDAVVAALATFKSPRP